MTFSTDYQEIFQLVNRFDPKNYARTRYHIRGEVSRLSTYISRGVISTKSVRDNLLSRSYDLSKIEKFVQELAWRDYWQQIWIAKGQTIDKDLKRALTLVDHHQIPRTIVGANTGIEAIDKAK